MAFDNPVFNASVYSNGTLLGVAGATATSVTGATLTTLTNLGAIVDLSTYDPDNALEAPVMTITASDDVLAEFLAPPALASVTTAGTGGTLSATTYYYCVTAVNANGETSASNVVSVTATNATSANTLTWSEPAVTVAGSTLVAVSQKPTSYNVYRGTSATVLDHLYAGVTSPWTDTNGTATSTATLVPTVNSATLAGQVVKQ